MRLVTVAVLAIASCAVVAAQLQLPTDRPDENPAKHQIHFVYAIPSDGTYDGWDTNGTLHNSIAAMQSWLAAQTSGRRLQVDTFAGKAEISFLKLQQTNDQMKVRNDRAVESLEAELARSGLNHSGKLYAVYYDGENDKSCGTTAVNPYGMSCAGSAGTGERALRVSVDAALRAGIFKASGSIDPIGFGDERERGLPRPWSSSR